MSPIALASDLAALAGAALITAGAFSAQPFRTSLGTDGLDDSLLAPEIKASPPILHEDAMGRAAAKRAVDVTVDEVPVTPPAVDRMDRALGAQAA